MNSPFTFHAKASRRIAEARARTMTIAVSLVLASATASAAQEAEIEQVRGATTKLINQLVEQGVLTREKGATLLEELTRPLATAAKNAAGAAPNAPAAAGSTVRVPYVPEFVRKELKEEIRSELVAQAQREGWAGPGAVPGWVRGIELDGDLRFRVESDRFADGNAQQVSVGDTNRNRALTLLNTTEDRNRLRFRGRFGVTATLDENWSGGVRLTTGNATDPLSSNQTLGNYNNRYAVLFDRAYVRYRYEDQFNVVAGRFGNPWFGTDLVWSNDLSFDGVAAQWTPRLGSSVRGFLTLAALPVQEIELASADKWLFGAQVGATLAGSARSVGAKFGVGYYRYSNLLGQVSPTGSGINEFTAPQFTQKGNTYYNISSDSTRPLFGLASEYRLVNVTGQIDLPSYAGKRLIATGDYVRNVGFKRADVSARVGQDIAPEVTGYHVRVAFGDGEVKALKDWQVFAAYKRVQRDAVLDAFTDSDFRLGGTNAKGYILGASVGLGKNTSAGLRFFSGDSVSGPPLSIDVLQLDLNVRF